MIRSVLSLAVITLAACATEPEIIREPYVPPAEFPTFPDPRGEVEFDSETGEVTMSLDYWQRITDYVIDVRSLEARLDIWREEFDDVPGHDSES